MKLVSDPKTDNSVYCLAAPHDRACAEYQVRPVSPPPYPQANLFASITFNTEDYPGCTERDILSVMVNRLEFLAQGEEKYAKASEQVKMALSSLEE